jgi:hypothetical protein
VLRNLRSQRAFLWTTTTAARDPAARRHVEIIAPVSLRATFGLEDGDRVEIELSSGTGGHGEAGSG